MSMDAKRLRMLLSAPALAVKAQEWGAAVSAGDQGVSQCVHGATRALRGHSFETHADALAQPAINHLQSF